MTGNEIRITRVIDAPRDAVWKAWTEPWRLDRWMSPKDFTSHGNKVDLRVGGAHVSCMRTPDGKDIWSTGTYKEIDKPRRLVMTDSFADARGNIVPASHYGMGDDFPLELLVTVTIDDLGDKTALYLIHSGVETLDPKMRDGMEQGWNECFDKLDAFVKSARRTSILAEAGGKTITTTRVFDAQRDVVFRVMTDPALIPRWWGPRRLVTRVDRMNFQPGGTWRFVQRDTDGSVHGFHGEYKDIEVPLRFVQSFEYERMPGHVMTESNTFEEKGAKTLVTTVSTFESVEDRDGMLETGVEEGTIESNERIDELIEGMTSGAVLCTRTGCTTS